MSVAVQLRICTPYIVRKNDATSHYLSCIGFEVSSTPDTSFPFRQTCLDDGRQRDLNMALGDEMRLTFANCEAWLAR